MQTELITQLNDFLWSYVLVVALIGCGLWFTVKTRFVQFRMVGEMVRLLTDAALPGGKNGKHISSFQAFAVSVATRVGTGNLAGVATAIAIGGPGAVFWMWVIALIGSATAFVESTLGQLYNPTFLNRCLNDFYLEDMTVEHIRCQCREYLVGVMFPRLHRTPDV